MDPCYSISNNDVFITDFSALCKDRVHGNVSRGGVFVVLRNDIIVTHQVDHVDLGADCEIMWVQIQLAGCKNIVVGSFYRQQNLDDPDFLEEVENIIVKN